MINQNTCMISLDIETTGTKPGCGILSIGATTFSLNSDFEASYFDMTIDQSTRPDTLEDELETLGWWDSQDLSVRKRNFTGTCSHYYSLIELYKWIQGVSKDKRNKLIWAKGTHFDIPILEHCYDLFHIPIPWEFREIMDLRTLQEVHHKINFPRRCGPAHLALDDAIHQAQCIAKILRSIY